MRRNKCTFQHETTEKLDKIYKRMTLKTWVIRQQRTMKPETWKQNRWTLQLLKLISWWQFLGHKAEREAEAEGNFHELKIWVCRKAKIARIRGATSQRGESCKEKEFWRSADRPLEYAAECYSVRKYEKITPRRERTTRRTKEQHLGGHTGPERVHVLKSQSRILHTSQWIN